MMGLRQPDTVTALVTVSIVGTSTPVDPANSAPVATAPTVGAPDPATGMLAGRINASPTPTATR